MQGERQYRQGTAPSEICLAGTLSPSVHPSVSPSVSASVPPAVSLLVHLSVVLYSFSFSHRPLIPDCYFSYTYKLILECILVYTSS